MGINFDKLKFKSLYSSRYSNINLTIENFQLNNLLRSNNIEPSNLETQNSSRKFLSSKSLTSDYETSQLKSQLSILFDETILYLNVDLLLYIYNHVLPILDDYSVINSSMPFNVGSHTFYKAQMSNEFNQNRWETKYYFLILASFQTFILKFDPELEQSFNRTFVLKTTFDFTYEIKNGISELKFILKEFPLDFESSGPSDQNGIVKRFLDLQDLSLSACFVSNNISSFEATIDTLVCNLSFKNLKLLYGVFNKYIVNPSTSSKSSQNYLVKCSENTCTPNVFQPHNLCTHSLGLESGYDKLGIYVDQNVYARYIDGFYYVSKVLMISSSHYVVTILQMNVDYEISAKDKVAIIPFSAIKTKNFTKNDLVLMKNARNESKNYKIGQINEISDEYVIIQSFHDYSFEKTKMDNVLVFPRSFLSKYKGIGLRLFVRYTDGVFYPSIVMKRKSFAITYLVFRSTNTSVKTVHRLVDDSSFAFMWDQINLNSIQSGDKVLVILKNQPECFGKVATFIKQQNSLVYVKYFHDGNRLQVPTSDCLNVRQQQYGINGLGSRFYALMENKIFPILQISGFSDNQRYFNPKSQAEIRSKRIERLFVDSKPSAKILYPFQPVIINLDKGRKSYSVGNILGRCDTSNYYVMLPDGDVRLFEISKLIIRNPKAKIVKQIPLSLIDQEV
ncbi:hypothetical protein RF11_06870 [Thelohanellus kitauei]|uniref:Uncharacterized protein n=1 Tax=Thelohanellus kitauei TaxID=669202 RepID=A0A0C2IA98_THEKT|nr:hypothetical protein RF11_06870 [Thelohanellus kitauei]